MIQALYPTFWDKACEMTDMLKEHAHEPEIEMGIWSTRATLDIIGIAGFGRDVWTTRFTSYLLPADNHSSMHSRTRLTNLSLTSRMSSNLMVRRSSSSHSTCCSRTGSYRRSPSGAFHVNSIASRLHYIRRVMISPVNDEPNYPTLRRLR